MSAHEKRPSGICYAFMHICFCGNWQQWLNPKRTVRVAACCLWVASSSLAAMLAGQLSVCCHPLPGKPCWNGTQQCLFSYFLFMNLSIEPNWNIVQISSSVLNPPQRCCLCLWSALRLWAKWCPKEAKMVFRLSNTTVNLLVNWRVAL